MKKTIYASILFLGFPIGMVCVLSLPLIKMGIVKPDPSPWNWYTVYIVDFIYGLTLLAQLVGMLRKASWGRSLMLVVSGYTVFAFAQTALEALLDMAGIQDAPIINPVFILTFMLLGLILGILMIVFAISYPNHWQYPSASSRPVPERSV